MASDRYCGGSVFSEFPAPLRCECQLQGTVQSHFCVYRFRAFLKQDNGIKLVQGVSPGKQ